MRFKDVRVELWIDSYRELLDQWQMWEERALLDTSFAKYLGNAVEPRPPEVLIKCTFCSQSLMRGSSLQSKLAMRGTSYAANKPKSTSCPSCRKPLPKCSVCLMHMGSPAESMGDTKEQDTSISYSFAWCTMCKHGGHIKHLLEWFGTRNVCPVSGCNCHCGMRS